MSIPGLILILIVVRRTLILILVDGLIIVKIVITLIVIFPFLVSIVLIFRCLRIMIIPDVDVIRDLLDVSVLILTLIRKISLCLCRRATVDQRICIILIVICKLIGV